MPDASPLLLVIPVYNDWDSLRPLLAATGEILQKAGRAAEVLIVDDASTEPAELCRPGGLGTVRVLELRRNLGHQRAICVGLAYAAEHLRPAAVVVMDADGEDDPADLPKLLEAFDEAGGKAVIFAGRARRTEGIGFRLFYQLFKLLHRLLVGRAVRVGNYSVLSGKMLGRLVVVSELWNHYAAAVVKARLPHRIVPTKRGRRLAGKSKMNFVSLVVHGLSALSVYADTIGVRVLVGLAAMIGLTAVAGVAVVAVRLATSWAVPGWATYTVGLLLVLLVQLSMMAAALVALVLSGRQAATFLPIRDYGFFCGRVWEVDGGSK